MKAPRSKRLGRLLLLFFISLIAIQVIVSSTISNSGEEITQLNLEIQKISDENQLLKEKIASESALTRISKRAEEQGFIKKAIPQFLTDVLPVAVTIK